MKSKPTHFLKGLDPEHLWECEQILHGMRLSHEDFDIESPTWKGIAAILIACIERDTGDTWENCMAFLQHLDERGCLNTRLPRFGKSRPFNVLDRALRGVNPPPTPKWAERP